MVIVLQIFHPEIPDIYEKKNISKLLYCLCALIHHIGFDLKVENRTVFSGTFIALIYFLGLICNLF